MHNKSSQKKNLSTNTQRLELFYKLR